MPAPDRPLDGTRILLTRARRDSASLRSSLEHLGAAVLEPPALLVAAVGPSTRAELEAVGVCVDCVPSEATSTALGAEMALRGVRDARVLLPVGDLARPDLENALQRAGARVHQVNAYRTVRPLDIDPAGLEVLRTGGIDVLAVASPSAIRNLAELLSAAGGDRLDGLRDVRIACIGPSTAAAVRDLLLEPAVVARQHTIDGLVEAIVELCSRENVSGPS